LLDTNVPDAEKPQLFPVGEVYAMTGRSVVAFQLTALG
jgi:hypothetical protein